MLHVPDVGGLGQSESVVQALVQMSAIMIIWHESYVPVQVLCEPGPEQATP
jgi:hypothetical protein